MHCAAAFFERCIAEVRKNVHNVQNADNARKNTAFPLVCRNRALTLGQIKNDDFCTPYSCATFMLRNWYWYRYLLKSSNVRSFVLAVSLVLSNLSQSSRTSASVLIPWSTVEVSALSAPLATLSILTCAGVATLLFGSVTIKKSESE